MVMVAEPLELKSEISFGKGQRVRVEIPVYGSGIEIKTVTLGALTKDLGFGKRFKRSREFGRYMYGSIIGGPYAEKGQKKGIKEYTVQWNGGKKSIRTSTLREDLLIPLVGKRI